MCAKRKPEGLIEETRSSAWAQVERVRKDAELAKHRTRR